MKPDSSCPPFYPDVISLWLHPDLFDETKPVRSRGWKFVGLYVLSTLLSMLIIVIPMALLAGTDGYKVILVIWIAVCFPAGIGIGLFTWRDFNRALRKVEQKNEQ